MSRVSYDKDMRADAKAGKEGLYTFDTVCPNGGRVTIQGRCTQEEIGAIRKYAFTRSILKEQE
jgi:hypothetical protein